MFRPVLTMAFIALLALPGMVQAGQIIIQNSDNDDVVYRGRGQVTIYQPTYYGMNVYRPGRDDYNNGMQIIQSVPYNGFYNPYAQPFYNPYQSQSVPYSPSYSLGRAAGAASR